MKPVDLSRRTFVRLAAATLVPAGVPAGPWQQAHLTARQLVDRIRERVGVPWREKSADGFKAGDPATVLTGVATTAMATLPVLRRAVEAGHNLIIAHEPTFYSPGDDPGTRAQDPIYVAKKGFIDQQRLVIWRFVDHWNDRRPSEAATALAGLLSWQGRRLPGAEEIFRVPETTFAALLSHVKSRLGVHGAVRSVGRGNMPVRTVLLSPGTTDMASTMAGLPRADVILAGEPREWEVVPYVLDTRTAGQEKGLIALGRIVSEEPGARACAAWIRSFTPEVPVESIAVGNPYWSPAA